MKTKTILTAMLSLTLVGCATRTEPTKHYKDTPYKILTKMNMANYLGEAFRRVREREPALKWSVVDETPESFRIHCAWRKNSFDIALVLKEKGYNVEYITSENLKANEDGSEMYYAYNKFVGYFMEEMWDINQGIYTDPLRKATRSTFFGGDYWNEHNPQNAAQALQSFSRQNARAANAQDGMLVSTVQTIQCPFCKKEIGEGTRFCPECGKSLVKVCPKCQTPVTGKFCSSCGQKVE